MPQMAPLWWETLFIMFIFTFMLMNMLIYFNKLMLPKKNKSNFKKKLEQMKWKW